MSDDEVTVGDGISFSLKVNDERPPERVGLPSAQDDQLQVREDVEFILTDHDTGEVVEHRKISNAVTANGKNAIADQLLAAPTLGKPTHMAIGTGVPAANALGAEVARVALGTKTRAANVTTLPGDFPAGTGTAALTEQGVFDAGAAGNMLLSSNFAVINKDANLDLQVNHTITIN